MLSLPVHKILCFCWWEYFGSSLAIAHRIKVHYLCIIFTYNFLFLELAGLQEHSFTCLEAVYNFPRGCWRAEHHCWCCASAANQGCPLPPWAVQHSTAAAHSSAALVHKEMEGNGGDFPRSTTDTECALPPGNLLSGDQRVLLCLSLELCLLKTLHLLHGRPLPLAGTSQVSSTLAKSLGLGEGEEGWMGMGHELATCYTFTSCISIPINKPLQKEEENWAFNKSPLFTQNC